MLAMGKGSSGYIISSELAARNARFNASLPPLLTYLRSQSVFHEIDAENPQEKVERLLEPTIIHVRHGNNTKLKREVVAGLEGAGFINLEVAQLMSDETNRGTPIGQEF